jgi:hypothetical protein
VGITYHPNQSVLGSYTYTVSNLNPSSSYSAGDLLGTTN